MDEMGRGKESGVLYEGGTVGRGRRIKVGGRRMYPHITQHHHRSVSRCVDKEKTHKQLGGISLASDKELLALSHKQLDLEHEHRLQLSLSQSEWRIVTREARRQKPHIPDYLYRSEQCRQRGNRRRIGRFTYGPPYYLILQGANFSSRKLVMSASLVYRNTMNSSGLDEQNAYRLAMELSILGLNSQGAPVPSSMEDDHLHHDGSEFGSQDINFANKISQPIMEDPLAFQNGARKSANMTETVPVPSSEHVAEIVGRQGKTYNQFLHVAGSCVFK